jgi:hypothetical protein
MFQTGDLVRIQSGYADPSGQEFDWVGMILSYRGQGGLGEEHEWLVQWAHTAQPAVEYGYYLEVL